MMNHVAPVQTDEGGGVEGISSDQFIQNFAKSSIRRRYRSTLAFTADIFVFAVTTVKYLSWRRLVKHIGLGSNQNIGTKKVAITVENIGASQLLGARARTSP